MDGIFLALTFISLICFLYSLANPQIFFALFGNKLQTGGVRVVLFLAIPFFFILFGITTDLKDSKSNVAVEQTPTKEVVEQTPTQGVIENSQEAKKEPEKPAETNKTPQQVLEENLTNIVNKIASSEMNYRDLKIEKSDKDRPKNTQMITVGVNVKSFLTKASLLRDTGKLSSSLFKAVYDTPSMMAYDVFVYYYAETKDRYGNTNEDVGLTYHIDKSTYEKINWQNFDQTKLCDFLEQEATMTGTFDTGCKTLVNIK